MLGLKLIHVSKRGYCSAPTHHRKQLSISPLETNFAEILMKVHVFLQENVKLLSITPAEKSFDMWFLSTNLTIQEKSVQKFRL